MEEGKKKKGGSKSKIYVVILVRIVIMQRSRICISIITKDTLALAKKLTVSYSEK